MKTILLTAVGSMAAGPVCDRLHQLGHRVIGCDIYPKAWNVTPWAMDEFFQAELATNQAAYLAQLRDAVRRYAVDFLIPLTDVEVDALCPRKAEFAAMGCLVCAPDESAARLCRVKPDMNKSLADGNVCKTIPTYDAYAYAPAPEDFPVMLKPQSGRSSQGQVVAQDLESYRAALPLRGDLIAQPYLDGPVWTVDLARDRFGGVWTAARQELLRNPSGLGMTVQIVPEHPLCEVCARIAARAGIVGAVNIEFIEHGGEFWFLEVNPRYSGGVGFSMLAGADFAAAMLCCHAGERLGAQPALKPLTIARKSELVVTQTDSSIARR